MRPSLVAPVVTWLCHETCPESGGVFEASGGWVGRYKFHRSRGKVFIPLDTLTPETVRESWDQIVNMESATYPLSTQGKFLKCFAIHLINLFNEDHMTQLVNGLTQNLAQSDVRMETSVLGRKGYHTYTVDEAILYALGGNEKKAFLS